MIVTVRAALKRWPIIGRGRTGSGTASRTMSAARSSIWRWKTTTFLAALRCDRIEAPWVLDGPIDGESFTIYVEKILLPTLKSGDIVIMDNLGSHKGKAVRELIRSVGAKLFFLPKYSPDLNRSEEHTSELQSPDHIVCRLLLETK